MKSITLNRYWQGMSTPQYAPGDYDESTMPVDLMTYLVKNGHADWGPQVIVKEVTPADVAAYLAERVALSKAAEGDASQWLMEPREGEAYKDAMSRQSKEAGESLSNLSLPVEDGDRDTEDATQDAMDTPIETRDKRRK